MIFLLSLLTLLNQQGGWFYLYTLNDTIFPVEVTPHSSGSGEGLELQGTKTVSLSTGSDGSVQIHQGMQLTINGNIGKWGYIQGVINDNSESPSSILSRTLTGYSEVYLKYTYRDLIWNFGKINYSSEFYSTPMIGGIMEYKGGPKFKVAYGEVPGELKIRVFSGIKNPAVPIRITDGEEKIVEGTIKVYLNGKPLKEGKDFSIDYVSGTLYILPGLEIDPEDRLRVEYVTRESFGKRRLTAFEVSIKKEHYFKLSFTEEGDDKDYWLENLGREALDSLKNSSGTVNVPAWKFVGKGLGDYDFVDSVFVFKGEGNGSYTVNFSYVGKCNGDYKFNDAGGFFYFAGRGHGDYIPYISLKPPVKERRVFVNSGIRYRNFNLLSRLQLEFFNDNVFSHSLKHRNIEGFIGANYSGKIIKGEFWIFQNDSGGHLLGEKLEDLTGRGFLLSLSLQKFHNFRPGMLLSLTEKGYFTKLWLSGRFYRIFLEESDSQKNYGLKVSFSSRNIRPYLGFRRFLSRDFAYSELSGGIEYAPYMTIRSSRRIFDNQRVERDLNFRFQTNRLFLGYRLVSTSPGDSVFQLVYGKFSGFSKEMGYFLKLVFREDLKDEFSYRYVFVGEGNGSFSYDSTTGSFYHDPLGSYERQIIVAGNSMGVRNLSGDFSLNLKGLSLKYSGDFKFSDKLISSQRNFYFTYTGKSFHSSYTNVSGKQADETNNFEEGMVELAGKSIKPGVRFSKVGGEEIQPDIYAEIYIKLLRKNAVYKLGSLVRPSYPAGLLGGVRLDTQLLEGSIGVDLDMTYTTDAPSGVYPGKGFSLMYTLTYRHRIFSNTGGIFELRGRKNKSRHIYNFRASLSIQF